METVKTSLSFSSFSVGVCVTCTYSHRHIISFFLFAFYYTKTWMLKAVVRFFFFYLHDFFVLVLSSVLIRAEVDLQMEVIIFYHL